MKRARQMNFGRVAALDGAAVLRIREGLGLTQQELGALVGVHAVTICAIERGHRVPAPYVVALLEVARRAVGRYPDLRPVLLRRGPVRALFELLRVAYAPAPRRQRQKGTDERPRDPHD